MDDAAPAAVAARIVANRGRQCELYGAPLGDRVHRLTGVLGISQARLARTLGLSPAMLSQLVSARRVKIGDPAVLVRLLVLDQRCHGLAARPGPRTVDALLADASRARLQWSRGPGTGRDVPERPGTPVRSQPGGTAAEALRRIAEPARLAAAAAALGPTFPELAEVLRQAAGRPRRARAD